MAKTKKKFKIPVKKHDKMKAEIKEMLQHLGISKRYFKKTMPRVAGSGDNFHRVEQKLASLKRFKAGHPPSLKQQWLILRELVTMDAQFKKQAEETKAQILEDQAAKSAMQEQAGEKIEKEQLEGLVSSVFDRDH